MISESLVPPLLVTGIAGAGLMLSGSQFIHAIFENTLKRKFKLSDENLIPPSVITEAYRQTYFLTYITIFIFLFSEIPLCLYIVFFNNLMILLYLSYSLIISATIIFIWNVIGAIDLI